MGRTAHRAKCPGFSAVLTVAATFLLVRTATAVTANKIMTGEDEGCSGYRGSTCDECTDGRVSPCPNVCRGGNCPHSCGSDCVRLTSAAHERRADTEQTCCHDTPMVPSCDASCDDSCDDWIGLGDCDHGCDDSCDQCTGSWRCSCDLGCDAGCDDWAGLGDCDESCDDSCDMCTGSCTSTCTCATVESQHCISLGSNCYRTRYADANNNYGNGDSCTITVHSGPLRVQVIRFRTESSYDKLRVDGTAYSGTSGPHNAIVRNNLQWSSDGSVTNLGWHICLHRLSVPTQPPTWPTQHPTWPTQRPTWPTQHPTWPTQRPTWPTQHPTWPTQRPTWPTQHPTWPTQWPTAPTQWPTWPTQHPTWPTQWPTAPTQWPTAPTQWPTWPTQHPTWPTQRPTAPTQWPTWPTQHPTWPTQLPTAPTQWPTAPTQWPTAPTSWPTTNLTGHPTRPTAPTSWPTPPTEYPTSPTSWPTEYPTSPTSWPTWFPSPQSSPTGFPTRTGFPSRHPSGFPSGFPSVFPSGFPGGFPSGFPNQGTPAMPGPVQLSSCAASSGRYTVDGVPRNTPCFLSGQARHVDYIDVFGTTARLYTCSKGRGHHFVFCTCSGATCASGEEPRNCFVPSSRSMGCIGALRGAVFSSDGTKAFFACNNEVQVCRVDLSSRNGQWYSNCQSVENAGCPRWAAIRGIAARSRPGRGDLLTVVCTDWKTRACSLDTDNMRMQPGRQCVKGGRETLCNGIGKPTAISFSSANRLITACDSGYTYSKFVGGIVTDPVHTAYNGLAPCPDLAETKAIIQLGSGRAVVACGPDPIRECQLQYS